MLRQLFTTGLLCLGAAATAAEPTTVTTEIFNGRDLTGWSLVTAAGPGVQPSYTVGPEGVLALAGTPVGYLLTEISYENYELHLEYRWPADAAPRSNSGVLLHVASAPVGTSPWPTCLQLQMKPQNAGDLLQMAGAKFAEPVTSPAKGSVPPLRAREEPSSEKPLGEWNALAVVCHDGAIEVRVNGVLQNRVTQAEPQAGRLGIQLEGTPFELRRVRLTPLPAR